MQRRPGIRIIHSASTPAHSFYGGARDGGARAGGRRRALEEADRIQAILRAASQQYRARGNLDGIPNLIQYDDRNLGTEEAWGHETDRGKGASVGRSEEHDLHGRRRVADSLSSKERGGGDSGGGTTSTPD